MLALAFAAHAEPWEFATRKEGRHVAFVKVHGTCEATLVFSRLADAARKPVTKDNATTPPLVIELWLTNAKQAAPFDFNDYEGPDAKGGPVIVTLSGKGKPWTRNLGASGWFSPLRDPTGASDKHRDAGEAEVFVFGIGDAFSGYRDLLHIADTIAAGAESFSIDIGGSKKSAPHLRFDVPLAGASEAMKQLLATKP